MVRDLRELISGSTHLLAGLMSVAGFVVLVVEAARGASVWHVVSFAVFGVTSGRLRARESGGQSVPQRRPTTLRPRRTTSERSKTQQEVFSMNSLTAHDETDHPYHPTEEPREQALASLSDVERCHIERVLEVARWNQPRAARILGISRWSLGRRLHKYGMHRPGRAQPA